MGRRVINGKINLSSTCTEIVGFLGVQKSVKGGGGQWQIYLSRTEIAEFLGEQV